MLDLVVTDAHYNKLPGVSYTLQLELSFAWYYRYM